MKDGDYLALSVCQAGPMLCTGWRWDNERDQQSLVLKEQLCSDPGDMLLGVKWEGV